MKKQEFLNYFTLDEKDQVLSIYDKLLAGEKLNIPVYTQEFYPPNIWNKLKFIGEALDAHIEFIGGMDQGERRIIVFNYEENMNLPYVILKIVCKSKFHKLTHKDYLGAVMALGIKREKFGDLVVNEDVAYIPTCKDISNFIIDNLNSIGKSPCTIEIISNNNDVPKKKFQEVIKLTSSMRLDCVVSSLTGLSRGASEKYIQEGMILVNYLPIKEKNHVIKEEDVLTIRQYGKFKIKQLLGISSKGRIRFLAMKYI